MKKENQSKTKFHIFSHHLSSTTKVTFWFTTGILIGIFFLCSFAFILFQRYYKDVVYPGVAINGVHVGGKTQSEIKEFYENKNSAIKNTQFVFTVDNEIATLSAETLNVGYNANLLAEQSYSVGRSENLFSNISLIVQAYLNGISLSPSYHYDKDHLQTALKPLAQTVFVMPQDAQFQFENGKVAAFRPSIDGQEADLITVEKKFHDTIPLVIAAREAKTITFAIPVKVKEPAITTEEANDLGIKELIGTGTSLFQHSIPNRIYNITLASSRLNGILIKPGETFSFAKAIGDISSFTGYKQAYIIQNGRTILGDGGGVCQVSTTLFRAALDAGLPIVERHPHAYRVEYYEQDRGPGIDASVFVPSVDFKFKNDTKHHLLIQTFVDPTYQKLTFLLYGTSDGRVTTISDPVIVSQSPAPPPVYQDDPTLPNGTVKQVDFAAAGASVYFTRTVTKDGKVITNDKFSSYYRPWAAVYLRGTQG